MLVKKIKWTDFDGNEREKNFYFNFSEAEIHEMNLRTPGGMKGRLQKLIDEQNPDKLVTYFKSLILDSYGVKSEDGIRFIKSPELAEAFSQTGAYNKLFIELTTNTESAVAFVNGIIPDTTDTVTVEGVPSDVVS